MRIVRHFSVSTVFFFLSIVITTAFAQQKELAPPFLQNNIDQNWLQQVKRHIEHSEYFIQRQENESAYQSPNRAQNLRFTYYENGFKVQPHTDGEEWQVEFRLKTVDRGEKGLPIEKMVLSAEENKLKATSPSLDIQYRNDKNGMRQDFIIKERPDGKNSLRLNFAATLDKATLAVKPSEVIVASKKKGRSNVMRYSDLKVWDRNGKHLKAWMEKTRDDAFAIVVDDRNAEYPVTVDPISTPWYVSGNQSNALLGWKVGTAGDVNGDGYSDVIIGAYGINTVYVYYGHSGGLSPANSPDWIATGSGDFGFGVGTAGDINGDGLADVIISALTSNTVYVYHGHSSGLSSSPDWFVTLTGKFGWGVGTAGDVNGDGFADVIVGARDYDDLGAAFIYHGSSTGLSSTPATTIMGPAQSPPREDTHTLGGPSPYPYLSYFGLPVGCAGDVNDDGYDDVFIGAERYDQNPDGPINEGAAYVYYGSSSGVTETGYWMTHPVGLEDASVNHEYNYYGMGMGSAGDVNEDGYSDVVVSAYKYPNNPTNNGNANGKLYLFYGSGSGLSTLPAWTYEGDLWDGLGYSVKTAGDVNGDGHEDLIAGGRYANGWSGKVFVFFGTGNGTSPYTSPVSLVKGQIQQQLNNNTITVGELGIDVGSAGDIDQDGYSDIIVGAWSTTDGYSSEGLALVYYGGKDYAGDFSLPVELTSFTGTLSETGARLNWTTETETDNLGFVLLRNGKQIASYQSNNQLKGQGTTTLQTSYTFFDAGIEVGKDYTYKLRSIDLNGTVHDYDMQVKIGTLDKYELAQNYPNPFNPTTTIQFSMKQAGKATVTVYDLLGKTVKTEAMDAIKGWNNYQFDGSGLATGMYFYRLTTTQGFSNTKKMMLIK